MPKTPELEEVHYREFVGQRDSEEIVMVLFKHWYTLVAPIVGSLLIIAISFALPIWLGIAEFIFRYAFTAAVYYLWLVFWVCSIIYHYLTWYQDRFIVTSERIVNIDQLGLFSRQVSEVELDRIQNITHTIKGLPATVFNFGTVTVQSAGANDIVLRHVAYPAEIQEEITRLVKEVGETSKPDPADIAEFIRRQKI